MGSLVWLDEKSDGFTNQFAYYSLSPLSGYPVAHEGFEYFNPHRWTGAPEPGNISQCMPCKISAFMQMKDPPLYPYYQLN